MRSRPKCAARTKCYREHVHCQALGLGRAFLQLVEAPVGVTSADFVVRLLLEDGARPLAEVVPVPRASPESAAGGSGLLADEAAVWLPSEREEDPDLASAELPPTTAWPAEKPVSPLPSSASSWLGIPGGRLPWSLLPLAAMLAGLLYTKPRCSYLGGGRGYSFEGTRDQHELIDASEPTRPHSPARPRARAAGGSKEGSDRSTP